MPLLEAVPNLSEGRRPRVLDGLAAAVMRVQGARLLHRTADPDHHRAVFTVAGPPAALQAAMVALAGEAVTRIDLGEHAGVHPRIGALDVVPFVPLAGCAMEEAVEAARRVGREIAERFAVPVFLYGEAASQPLRRSLAELRRGGLAGLAARMGEEAWRPDFGPPRPHATAGVTAVGARSFLVAFNVVLASGEVALARAVARRIREASGGLPAVKALGLYLASRDRAQVSMNLVDFRRTGMAAALAAVRREARALGVEAESCEIVGLVPAAALAEAAGDEMLAEALGPQIVLEEQLRRCGLA